MRKALAIGVLLLLISFFAYSTYTYHELSSAVGAYKLAGIPKSEKLIAAYHDSNLWQFATYDEKTNTLKLYTVKQSSPFWPKERRVESAKALVNYSPLSFDLKLLKQYEPHEKALLFKTLGWKYDSQINGSYWWNLSEIIKPNETFYQIYALGSSSGLWIKSKTVCEKRSLFANDYLCYGRIGVSGVLVFPYYEGTKLLWIKIVPEEQGGEVRAYYPGVILTGQSGAGKTFTFGSHDRRIIERMLEKLENDSAKIIDLTLYVKPKRLLDYYAEGHSLNKDYCWIWAVYKESQEMNITGSLCFSNWELVSKE